MSKKEKSEKELLEEISKKLDKLIGVVSANNQGLDIDSKIKILKNLGFESDEIGPFVNLTGSSIRKKKGFQNNCAPVIRLFHPETASSFL